MDSTIHSDSATCQGHLVIGDHRFPLARLNPQAFELSKPVDLPRTEAELVVVIDGDERRTRVSLDEGSSASVEHVPYRCL